MRDNTELPAEQQPLVKVYVLLNDDNQFTFMGSGYIEIATDALQFQYEHYIEVTNSENTKDMFLRSRLQSTNVYERQKNTVITWSDPEQQIKNDIGISFESNEACDMFWRLLCSKIGKNYLQINGREKLEMPNQRNVRYLLQKIKLSYNLVAYHVINSLEFMKAFWQTLHNLNLNPQPIKGITVLRELFSHFDPKIMAIFLSDEHFDNFLSVYQFEAKVNFRECYRKTQAANEIVELNEIVRKRIQLSLRAKFVRQFVIDHAKDFMMASMLNQVAKENLIEALISMLNENCIGKLVQIFNTSKDQDKQKRGPIITRILSFFLQCVWVLRIHHPDNLKAIFIGAFYSSGMLRVLAQMLNEGYYKALEILNCLAALDSDLFMIQFTNDYRSDSGNSILRIIGKQFAINPNPEFAYETVNFLKSLAGLMQTNKTMFQFFNKTTIYTIFACCKYPPRILPLIIVCIADLGALKSVFEQTSNFKYFQAIAEKIQKKQLCKSELLDVVRIIRLLLEQIKIENTETVKGAARQIIKSKLFTHCLTYLKENIQHNNLIVSSIISAIILISKLKHNQFTQTIQKFQFGDLSKKYQTALKGCLEKIKEIKDEETKEEINIVEHEFGKKRVHKTILDEEEEEKYLQQEDKIEKEDEEKLQVSLNQKFKAEEQMLKKLMEIRSEIHNKENGQNESTKESLKERSDKLKARKKQDDTIGFDFSEPEPQ